MKKLLLLSTFIVLTIFGTKTMAQSAMPKISDGTNTYWYYMKSHGDFTTDATNRSAKVLTKNAAGYYYGAETWNNKSTWAKFKVVAGSAEGKYDIVTEDGLFLKKGLPKTTILIILPIMYSLFTNFVCFGKIFYIFAA